MWGVGLGAVVLIAAVLLDGSLVQGVVGLGLGLVAAPVVTLAEPQLMPGFLLVLAMLLPAVTLAREHRDIDWSGLAWSLPTRVLGTAVGVWLVAVVDDRTLGLAVGLMVLLAVVVTASTVTIPLNRRTLATAGLVSGAAGTATSIGGPPLALLYQHRPPREVRTTMAVYFMVGAALSLVGLLVGGELTSTEVRLALAGVPFLVLGAALAVPLRDRLAGPRFRVAVLVLCGASSLVLIARSVLG